MCGIVAAIGTEPALPVLLQGLLRQDERGYDSAGIALFTATGLKVARRVGQLDVLQKHLAAGPLLEGTVGIAHTRWATHGGKTTKNAHPHLSHDRSVVVVQNGMVENFLPLRESLEQDGFRFRSETDTEVISNLIEQAFRDGAKSLEDAVAQTVPQIRGSNGIVVMSKNHPDQIVAASLGSPLVVGFLRRQLFLASAEKGLPDNCSVLHLADGEIVTLLADGNLRMRGTSPADWKPRVQKMTVSAKDLSKGEFEHFMLKEIMEQPAVLRRTLAGRLNVKGQSIQLGAFTRDIERRIAGSLGIKIVACGTSFNAGLAAKLYFESRCRIPVTVELASEFQPDSILGPQHVVIAISQSGETKDTLNALRLAKEKGALCVGVTNEPGSTLAHLVSPTGVFLKAGTEKAVASTKAFVAQVAVLALMAIHIAQVRGTSDSKSDARLIRGLGELPYFLEQALKTHEQVKAIASLYKKAKRVFFIGRRYGVPLAYEGALKLNEIAYVNSFGFAAGELKHGPIALVQKGVPVVAIVPNDGLEEKMISNLQEFMAKKGDVIALTTVGDKHNIRQFAKHVIELPDVPEELVPIVYAPVLQLLAYEMGLALGRNIDKPRNLAKTVTVV